MFAGTVYALERLFVQQDAEAVLTADLAHEGHYEQVVVVCQVAFFENRSQFELVRGYFVVARFQRNA